MSSPFEKFLPVIVLRALDTIAELCPGERTLVQPAPDYRNRHLYADFHLTDMEIERIQTGQHCARLCAAAIKIADGVGYRCDFVDLRQVPEVAEGASYDNLFYQTVDVPRGLSLRLEVTREHMRYRWELSTLVRWRR